MKLYPMKSKVFVSVALAAIVLVSCGGEPERDTGPDLPPENETPKVAEVRDIVYGIDDLPTDLNQVGEEIINAVRWKESTDHLLVLSLGQYVEEQPEDGEDYALPSSTQYLYGTHYYTDAETGEYLLLWRIQDFVKDCEFDLMMEFVDGTLEITDMDKDGIAESLFIYRMTCTSDVSPMTQKLIMHEGENKYALRGITDLEVVPGELEKGEMNIDPAFEADGVPNSFLIHARKVWGANKTLHMGV